MIATSGKIYLTQPKEVIPHINMQIIMNYVNRLHTTRRVARDWSLISKEEKNKMEIHPKYFGFQSVFYYKNDYPETIPDINDRGFNPSLVMPFYIEKEGKDYVLKCLENPKGNHSDSIAHWFYFLHKNIFYQLGVISNGEFSYIDHDTDESFIIKADKNGIIYKNSNMKNYSEIVEMEDFKEYMKDESAIEIHYPEFMEEISKKIQAKKLPEDYSFE